MKTCANCKQPFKPQLCPLPCYDCSCKGNYCRLLGRDPCEDLRCSKCGAKALAGGKRGGE